VAGPTLDQVILAYWEFARTYSRHPDGTPTGETAGLRPDLARLRPGHGDRPAAGFDSLALKGVRELMIAAGLARSKINKATGRIKRMFRWAAKKKMVPAGVYHDLLTVENRKPGRSNAKETKPVEPVADGVVARTLPHLRPTVAAMVRFQRLTGARPGEVCAMRPMDLDRSRPVWRYVPGSDAGLVGRHKNAWRGHRRVVRIGPKAQELILPRLDGLKPEEFVFSPRRAEAERKAAMRAARKSRVQPSQADRRKARPKRKPGVRCTSQSYGKSILRAVVAANKALLAAGRCGPAGLLPHWQPNQLRHAHGTEARKLYGYEGAQVALGHSRLSAATEVYAKADEQLAERIAQETG
jgi:integrase